MAIKNPYFKFYTSEWLNGRISLEDYELQGLFISICAIYWHSEGNLTISQANKRFKNPNGLQSLLDEGIILLSGENLCIDFLKTQLEARGVKSNINKVNGCKGGRPKKSGQTTVKTQTVISPEPKDNPKKTNIKDNKSIEERKIELKEELDGFIETYPHEMLNDFFLYWTEHGKDDKKMRFEKEKSFGIERRLATWAKHQKEWGNKNKPEHTGTQDKPKFSLGTQIDY